MTYYMLPKNNNIIYVNPSDSYDDLLKPYISHSLYHYYNQTRNEIEKICLKENDTSNNCFDELKLVINPNEIRVTKKQPNYDKLSQPFLNRENIETVARKNRSFNFFIQQLEQLTVI